MSDPIDPPSTGERATPDRDADRPTSGADRPSSGAERPRSGAARKDSGTVKPSPATNDGSAPDLQLAIVEYENRPDRGTIHPPQATGVDRMETWLSVDRDIVVDLSAWR